MCNNEFLIKTAIIIERLDVALGGAERSISELASQLAESGAEITILAAKGASVTKNVKVLCQDWKGKRTPLNVFEAALKNHLQDNHYHIIHSTLPFDFADIYQPRGGCYLEAMERNAASYRRGKSRELKKLTHFFNTKRYAMMQAEKALCKSPGETIVAALSDYVKRQFEDCYDLPAEHIRVIKNGVAIIKQPDTTIAKQMRKGWLDKLAKDKSKEPVIFLFAANNFRLKGLMSLLVATKIAMSANLEREICIVVAGNGKIRKYKRMAKKLGIAQNILFTGPLGQMQTAISASHIAVLPTFYDPCSRFILEAITSGKPVITTRFNGASEMFENYRHGVLIKDGDDINGLADAIKYFTKIENITKARNAIASDKLIDELSIKRHARQMVELYKWIIAGRSE